MISSPTAADAMVPRTIAAAFAGGCSSSSSAPAARREPSTNKRMAGKSSASMPFACVLETALPSTPAKAVLAVAGAACCPSRCYDELGRGRHTLGSPDAARLTDGAERRSEEAVCGVVRV